MHPYFYKRLESGCRFLLGNLRLVVGKDEVAAAAVNVVLRTEKLFRDRCVLDVPAGPSPSERRPPRRLAIHEDRLVLLFRIIRVRFRIFRIGLSEFPETKVASVSFARI